MAGRPGRGGGGSPRADGPGDGTPARPLASHRDPRLAVVRDLARGRARRETGLFVLEGPRVVLEVLAPAGPGGQAPAGSARAGAGPGRAGGAAGLVERVLLRADAGAPERERRQVDAVAAAAAAAGVEALFVTPSAFDALAGTDTPQGVLAVARQPWAALDDVLGPPPEPGRTPGPRGVAALVGVQDPGNVGTIARAARFFGLGLVVLPGAADPFGPKVVRASAGALLGRPPARAPDLAALLAAARARGLAPVALEAHGGLDPRREPLPARALLLLGAEGPGLPPLGPEVLRVTLAPADPGAESLNVAVAFGVVAALWAGRAAPGAT